MSGTPTTAGTYTVLASFAGSTDYTSGTASTTFTISQATPSVSVTDNGGTYTARPLRATVPASAVAGQPGRRHADADLLLGHQRHGHGFERRSDDGGHLHGAGQLRRQHRLHQRHGSTTFTISKAAPTVSVTDSGGTYTRFAPCRGDDRPASKA